jgi:leucyl-tRNA synthetase
MPGYAGSSWYFLRYMDPHNENEFASKEKINYWQNVDLYLGGSEHAVGHLLYSRLWHKFLHDLGYVPTEEPFKKLVNQGMIQGVSAWVYRLSGVNTTIGGPQIFVSYEIYRTLKPWLGKSIKALTFSNEDIPEEAKLYLEKLQTAIDNFGNGVFNTIDFTSRYVDVNIVDGNVLNENGLKSLPRLWTEKSIFVHDANGYITCEQAPEKMSKSKYNTFNPNDVIEKYGADAFRMFEMFLGPLDQSKPWDQQGIDGVSKFIRRFWRLFYDDQGTLKITGTRASSPLERTGGEDVLVTPAELKILHKTLKKISEDIERLQFNTCISQFMICLNELSELKCTKREILEPLLIALAPFAPFLTEELWQALGNSGSIHQATYPTIEEKYLVESSFNYPVSINGKVRAEIPLALDLDEASVKATVLSNDIISKWTNGTEPKKFIFVKGRIINVVV